MTDAFTPIPTLILTPGGVIPTPYRVPSLAAAISREPDGVYTVARTFFGDRALLLDAHLDRLEESARLSGIPLALDRARLRAALRDALHAAGFADAKFRITIPREDPSRLYLALEPFQPVPEAVRQEGAHVATLPIERANPAVKTTAWMTARQPSQDALPPGVYEGILRSADGRLLEGMSSNFYAVLDGALYTAGEGVLAGITRRAVLEIAAGMLPVRLEAPRSADSPRFEEAFITSSGRGVVPVTRIDGQPVASGAVGPITRELSARYDQWTEAHSAPI